MILTQAEIDQLTMGEEDPAVAPLGHVLEAQESKTLKAVAEWMETFCGNGSHIKHQKRERPRANCDTCRHILHEAFKKGHWPV